MLKKFWSATVLVGLFLPAVHAATIWNGPQITYTKSGSSSDTILAGKVVLKRNGSGPLYNTALGENSPRSGSPKGIEFGFGDLNDAENLSYQTLDSMRRNPHLSNVILNQPMVAHILDGDIYFSIKFTSWGMHGAGSVKYTRSTAAAVVVPPTVTLTSPTEGATFTSPATVNLSANANGGSGTITEVSFFNGANLAGTATTAPYNFTLNNLGAGPYSFTAVAKTADSAATSGVVHITVTAPVPPTVALTSPTEGATFTSPATVNLSANANGGSGTITEVSFFNGANLAGTVTTAPYNFTVNNLGAGPYSFTAVAKTADSAATSGVVHITVTAPVPVVALTSPTEGATFTAPATINLSANASGAPITSVLFFNGTTLLGSVSTAPYNLTFTNVSVGSYSLTAVATTAETAATSGVVHVTVSAPVGDVTLHPVALGNGQFSFGYPTDPGNSYIIQAASTISAAGEFNWTSVSTNTPSANTPGTATFSETLSTDHLRLFRVGRVAQ